METHAEIQVVDLPAPDTDVVPSALDANDAEEADYQDADDDNDNEDGEELGDGGQRSKRRKYAVFVAYVGAGYHGMQRNPGCPTIEEELERAFVKAGAIPQSLAGSFTAVKWSRSARTDKGVSAICQVVSARLVADPVETFPERVNKHLPDQIRILGIHRVTEGFAARMFCDKRRYEYILPEWVFDPAIGKGRTMADKLLGIERRAAQQQQRQQQQEEECGGGNEASSQGVRPDEGGVSGGSGGTMSRQDMKLERMRTEMERSTYQFTESERQRLNDILRQYWGTHNFHNYTIKADAYGGESQRYILSFECPCTFEINGKKWVRLVVLGQSFMLHQIRKMVGMAVAIMRGAAPPSCLVTALDPDRDFNVPMAPELGLFLAEAYFDAYNRRFGDVHGPMTLSEFADKAEAFKRDKVYPQMAERDERDLVNALWIRTLHNEPAFGFRTWESQPKIRQVQKKHAKQDKRGRASKEAAAVTIGAMAQEQREAKRAALSTPVAALAALAAQRQQEAGKAVQEQVLADEDELNALY